MRFSEGFTILEVVLVIGLLAIIFAMGIPITFDFYVNYELGAERDNLISILQQARDLAMSGKGGVAHGVYLDTNGYVIFEGVSYASRSADYDQNFSIAELIQTTGPDEIVFEALSGRTSPSVSFSVTNGKQTFNIDVNAEGRVQWEL